MKKVLIALVTLGAASVALANGHGYMPAPVAPNYFDGFVLGITGGVAHETGTVKNELEDATFQIDSFGNPVQYSLVNSYPEVIDSDIGSTNLDGGILAGFGQTLNSCYYLGLELFGRYAHANPEVKTAHGYTVVSPLGNTVPQFASATSVKVDSDFSYGGALKGGYLITPKTMFYLLAGVEYTKFDVNVDHGFVQVGSGQSLIPTILQPNIENEYSFSKGKWAFMPGVGLETMLTNNISLKAEYTYAWYGDLSHDNVTTNHVHSLNSLSSATGISSFSDTHVDNLSRGLFTLGLSYHFNGV